MGALHCEQIVSMVHPQFSLRSAIRAPRSNLLRTGGPDRTPPGLPPGIGEAKELGSG